MKPQLGDTLFNRYTLVTLLRDEPGVQAWQANDRVLDHDCQLFVLTDGKTLEDVSALATQLGRKNGLTPVLQFRRAGDAAVLVTRIESGLSLTEYLNGTARDNLSFEAMRSIIGEVAAIAGALETPRLSTDTIRISVQGVEIADAPLPDLLAEPTDAPDRVQGEQLAIRQLAAVLYALLTRTPSRPGITYDLRAVGDIPGEFQVILSRGLELTKEDGHRSEPMLTLLELTALLGDFKPLTDLTDSDIALPTDAGTGSIANVHLRDLGDDDMAELPSTVISSEKLPELTIHRPLTEAEAARHAEQVVAAQNKQTFAEMQEAFDNYSPRVLGVNASADQTVGLASSDNRTMALPTLPERPTRQAYQGDDLFHEFSFQTQAMPAGAPGADPGEETTRIPVLIDPNMATEAIDVSSIRRDLQADARRDAQAAARPEARRHQHADAGVRPAAPVPSIPPHTPDMDATIVGMAPIEHGEKPASFAPTPHVRGVAVPDSSMQQPPSFAPKTTPANSAANQGDDDNLAKQRLFGKMTTTVVVVIVASVLIIAGLAFAVITFVHSNSNPADSGIDKNNQWPSQQNLEDVPFGNESSSQSSDKSSDQSGAAASDIEFIDVTDAYRR